MLEYISFFVDELNKLPSGVYTVIGVIVGFGLTSLKDHYDKKPRLYYSLDAKRMPDDWDYALTTKTGESGFVLSIFNIGSAPVILNALSIGIKGNTVADIIIGYRTVMPYEQYEHILEKQDYEAIQHWCHKPNADMFQVTAYTVSDKKINGKLDISLIAMHNRISLWMYNAKM